MFFMIGFNTERKDLDFNQIITCDNCGSLANYNVFMTYTVLTLFFIPVFKWNKKYYVESSCCKSLYELDNEIGIRIEKGENVEILSEHLNLINNGYSGFKKCINCGYTLNKEFKYCPNCGAKL